MEVLEAMLEFLQLCPPLADMDSHVGYAEEGEGWTLHDEGEELLGLYWDGSRRRLHSYSLEIRLDSSTDSQRIANVKLLDQVSRWVNEQNDPELLPELPDRKKSEKIDCILGGMDAMSSDGMIGTYHISLQLTYVERGRSLYLNREKQFWISENPDSEQTNWMLLSAGIMELKVNRKSENILFFELGKEAFPQEKALSSVKYITFHGHLDEQDEALTKIISLHGREIGLLQEKMSNKYDNYGIFCKAQVEVIEDGSGCAGEPKSFEVRLKYGEEFPVEIIQGVNVVSFTSIKEAI